MPKPRYRYYVSHAILQQRKAEAGSVTRLPAAEIETLVLDSVRIHCTSRNDLTPKLHLVDRTPGDLVIPARNVRKIDPAHLREVANAIAALGYCVPVLIDEHNNVLDGVVRVAAAKQLGLASIPCVRG